MPQNKAQFEIVKQFYDPGHKVEILKKSYGVNDSLDLLVPRNHRDYIKDFVTQHNLSVIVKNERYGR